MANQTVKGTRVIVKLPFKGATDNEDQYVRIKKPVAELLGFSVAKPSQLYYEVEIAKK
jgi:hypothetical protein